MSGTIWSPEDSKKNDQRALEAIRKVVCYEKNGKMFLLLIFEDPGYIEYVREEMAFILDSGETKSLKDFDSLPNLIRRESLLVQIFQESKPHEISIFCLPTQGFQTKKDRTLPVIGYEVGQSAPNEGQKECPQAECPKT